MNYLDELFDQLEYVLKKDRTITLVTRVKGVSFSLIGKVLEISKNRGWIKITTHPTQKLSLLPSSRIELHNDLFVHPIQARVQSVDVKQRVAILEALDYIFEELGNRKYHRVEPEKTIQARIFNKYSRKYRAEIIDISPHGLSLRVEGEDDFTNSFRTDSSARVEFSLPLLEKEETFPVSFMTKIVYINLLEEKGKYRVGLKTWADAEEQDAIRQYIFDRQTQLVKEFTK